MAKFVPVDSDLVFQMHYTTNGHAARDQTRVGMVFARQPPKQRVLTLQLAYDQHAIPIPAGAENFRVGGTRPLPNNSHPLHSCPPIPSRDYLFFVTLNPNKH